MQTEITITVKPSDEKNTSIINAHIFNELKNRGIKTAGEKTEFVFVKKSIDARHGQVKLHLRYRIYIGEKPEEFSDTLPVWKKADGSRKVVIVGSGPAGLFGALKLLESGIKPVIVERGAMTSQRKRDIALISTQDNVNENSNYCFGEGGAGTFSDGKLYTRSNKRGDISKILRIFVNFGADPKILTDAHPHIGTDKLPAVINNMRAKIIELGGEFLFNTKLVGLVTDAAAGSAKDASLGATADGPAKNVPLGTTAGGSAKDAPLGATADATVRVTGVTVEDVITKEKKQIEADAVLLATGHSAPDIYELLAKTAPSSLEAKTFAAGVRVEHPRELIDAIQYHGRREANLGAAEYRVTTQVDGRGVYSFCMCPGGFVVPSSSGPNEIVVNGMSAAARNSKWSNAAIVVEIRPEDIPQEFVVKAKELGCPDLAGLLFRTQMELLAKQNGSGQAAPSQKLTDFLANRKSAELPATSYTPGIVSSNLNEWLPEHIRSRLQKGFAEINKSMKGFICDEALMIAIETRTSTPVRIKRDKETFECCGIQNLFPAGEGSGYSGGIVSSAMDGENACAVISKRLC